MTKKHYIQGNISKSGQPDSQRQHEFGKKKIMNKEQKRQMKREMELELRSIC